MTNQTASQISNMDNQIERAVTRLNDKHLAGGEVTEGDARYIWRLRQRRERLAVGQ